MLTQHCEENRGGHSIHFLQRLERAEGESAELALRLYHHPDVLRSVLFGIGIPKEIERVAISLDPADEGPYVVASSAGRFITCLGHGMGIHGLHLISHSRLLAYLAENKRRRARWDLAQSLVGEGQGPESLLRRVLYNGDNVTREEMIGVSAVQPLLMNKIPRWLIEHAGIVDDFAGILLRKKQINLNDKLVVRGLKTYWKFYFSAGHLALLAAMGGPRQFGKVAEELPPDFTPKLLFLLVSGSPAMALRLAWFVGKLGGLFFADCKQMLLAPPSPEAWLLGLLGVMAVGLRHSKTKPQVIKVVQSAFHSEKKYPADVRQFIDQIDPDPERFCGRILYVMMKPEKVADDFLFFAKRMYMSVQNDSVLPKNYRYNSPQQVPDSLAMTCMSRVSRCFHRDPAIVPHLLFMMPWIAQCEAEDFYFPADLQQHVHKHWRPEWSIEWIEREREARGIQKTVTVEKKPGRNDPCTCGSGKKYKKCCISAH